MDPGHDLSFGDAGRVVFSRSRKSGSVAVGLAHKGQIKNIVNLLFPFIYHSLRPVDSYLFLYFLNFKLNSPISPFSSLIFLSRAITLSSSSSIRFLWSIFSGVTASLFGVLLS